MCAPASPDIRSISLNKRVDLPATCSILQRKTRTNRKYGGNCAFSQNAEFSIETTNIQPKVATRYEWKKWVKNCHCNLQKLSRASISPTFSYCEIKGDPNETVSNWVQNTGCLGGTVFGRSPSTSDSKIDPKLISKLISQQSAAPWRVRPPRAPVAPSPPPLPWPPPPQQPRPPCCCCFYSCCCCRLSPRS